MKRIWMLVVIVPFLLAGCFGGGGDEGEGNKGFDPKSFITSEEMESIDNTEEKIVESNELEMMQIDFMIKNVLSEEDVDFYYPVDPGEDPVEVMKKQLLYLDVHRSYMKKLEEEGASTQELMYRNRLFSRYLDIFEGKKYGDVEFQKSIIEKYFKKMEIEELKTLNSGKSLKAHYKKMNEWEKDNKIREWFKKEENLNYEKDVMVEYDVKIGEVQEGDKESLKELHSVYEDIDKVVEENMFNGISLEDDIKELENVLDLSESTLEDIVISKEEAWVKDRVKDSIDFYRGYVEILKEGEELEAVEYINLRGMREIEDDVSLYEIEKELGLSGEKEENEKEMENTDESVEGK